MTMRDLDEPTPHLIHGLSQDIGGRGSCTQEERKAGEWIAERMRSLGLVDVRKEEFLAVPSTYWPFGLAFGLALTGSISSLIFPGMGAAFLGALLNGLGFGGMLAETNLKSRLAAVVTAAIAKSKSMRTYPRFRGAPGSGSDVRSS